MARRPTGIDRSRVTERGPDSVTKFYESIDRAEAAAEKYRQLSAIGPGAFRSPEPTMVVDDPPRIVFDLLPADTSIDVALGDALRGGDPVAAVELVGQAGLALATIHNDLTLTTTVSRSRGAALRAQLAPGALGAFGPTDSVILHGDFGFANIWVDDGGGLVIYDPEPSRYTSGAVDNRDFPEFDLATFVTCLAGRTRGIGNVRTLHRNFAVMRDGFLDTYREARTVAPERAFDRGRLAAVVIAQGSAYRSVAGRRSGTAVALLARWTARNLGPG